MRRRKKPGAKDELLSYEDLVITNPEKYKGKWKELLNKEELHIELGTGRGQFINTLAINNSHIAYIGIEIKEEVILEAVKKSHNNKLRNIKFLWFNIEELERIFDINEVDRIYINFCDPWPKKRHGRRRLTYREFLNKYMDLLKPLGEIHFKTDNEELFEFSLNEMSHVKLELKDIFLNLYRNEGMDTVKTEYEEKFIEQGKNIFSLKAVNNKK